MSRRRIRKVTGPSGGLVTPGRVGLVLLFLAALWIGSGFVSKMVVAYRLNAEVEDLQRQNQRMGDTNKEYGQQLSALSRPGGAEEQARLHNYVRPDEKVYVITASPTPGASPRVQTPAAPPTTAPSFWRDFWGALTSIFHS